MNSILQNEERINKLKASIKNAIKVRMQRYDSSSTFYDKKIIKQILYNNSSSAVSVFKDFLLFDDQNEFFKSSNAKIYPNYMLHLESKYIYKNILKKQKLIDCIQNVKKEIEISDENEIEFQKNRGKINNIINTQDFNSIMNQSLLTNNQEFPQFMLFFRKNNEDSIVSVENLIEKINKASDDQSIVNKNSDKTKNREGKIYLKQAKKEEISYKSAINFFSLKETISSDIMANTQKISIKPNEETNPGDTIKKNTINTISIENKTIRSKKNSVVKNLHSFKYPEDIKRVLKIHKLNGLEKEKRSISSEIICSTSVNNNMILKNISLRNSNPFQFIKILTKSNVDVKKSMKLFQNFSKQPIIKQLKKNNSNSSIFNHLSSTLKNINSNNDIPVLRLSRNSKSVNDLFNFPSVLKKNESKVINPNINNLNTISKREDKDSIFRTLSIRFEERKVNETINNQKISNFNIKDALQKKRQFLPKFTENNKLLDTIKSKPQDIPYKVEKIKSQSPRIDILSLNIDKLPTKIVVDKKSKSSKQKPEIKSVATNTCTTFFRKSNV